MSIEGHFDEDIYHMLKGCNNCHLKEKCFKGQRQELCPSDEQWMTVNTHPTEVWFVKR